jgi:hypothetical protein
MFGAAFAAAPLVRGRVWQGIMVVVVLGGRMYLTARLLLKTAVHSAGFEHNGWKHVEWADVADAVVERGPLHLTLRGGERAALPAAVLDDPRFADCVRGWLSTEHPVRRAVEGVRSRS